MSKQSLYKLGQIYGNMLNNISVVEEKTLPKKSGPGAKELNDKDAAKLQSGGPSEKGGFKPAEIDANKMSKKDAKDNAYNVKNLTAEEIPDEDEENLGKMNREAINNFMSKSIFEKLYENVMAGGVTDTDELDALGIETSGEEADDMMGGEEETVTITLDKQLAQKLHDVLMSVMGGEEDMGEMEDLEGEEDMDGEEDFGGMEEDEETMGHTLHGAKIPSEFCGKDNKVSSMKLKPNGKAGDGKYTDEVDGDAGDMGHALHGAKAPDMGKNNKVSSTKTSKPGSDAFAA
jgi:hypothetical protein